MKNMLLLLATTLFFTSTIFAQIPFPQDTIARNDRFNNRMFAAYDSQGKIHLSYTGQLGTDGATREIYYVKEEIDGSFTTANITNNFVDDNYSTLSIDANDKIHIGFTGRDASNLFQIKYANNINGSFGEPMFMTAGGLNKATPYTKVGPDSIVHFVFFTFTNDPDNIYYTRLDLSDSSIQITPTFLAPGETGGDFDAALDVDSQGKVHIVMKTGSAFGGPIRYMTDAGGFLTEVPTGVAGNITNPKIVVDKNDKIHIIYRLETDTRLYYINNVSGSFSAPLAITPPGQRPAFYQNFAIDDSNRVYVVYQSSVAASGRGFYFIYSDQGVFSDTLQIYDLTPEYVTRNSSAVIAKGNGDLALFYAPGGVRNSVVICDIFMHRGSLLQIIPVELASFSASVNGNDVLLNWSTASEINNRRFEVERQVGSLPDGKAGKQSAVGKWERIGFVEGKGTTTELNRYSYVDRSLSPGLYQYRIKQIDFDGTFEIYNLAETIEIGVPAEFVLEQNYPNPFNPSTVISYRLPVTGFVSLKIFDVLGNEVATLVDEYKPAGLYEVEFDASHLPSGVYMYRLQFDNRYSTQKMTLIK